MHIPQRSPHFCDVWLCCPLLGVWQIFVRYEFFFAEDVDLQPSVSCSVGEAGGPVFLLFSVAV